MLESIKKYGINYQPVFKKFLLVEGSLLQKSLDKLIRQPQIDKIKIITGLPGIGKTTVTNFLIKQLRKKNSIIYYMNLRHLMENQTTMTKKQKRQEIQNFIDGVFLEWGLKKNIPYKSVKIIIDDINNLEKFSEEDASQILQKIQGLAEKKNIDTICISSSSSFVKKILKISSIEKISQSYLVQHQTGQSYKKFVQKVIKKHCPTISQEAKNYMILQQYSLRKIVKKIRKFSTQKDPTKSELTYLDEEDKKQFKKLYKYVNNVFKLFDNTQIGLMLFNQLINSPQQISMQNCDDIEQKINEKFVLSKQTTKVGIAIQQLEKQNILMQCKPRQKIYKKALKTVYDKNKFQLQKNK